MLLRAVGSLEPEALAALRIYDSFDVSLDHDLSFSANLLKGVGKLGEVDALLLEGLRRVAAKADANLGPSAARC